MAVHYFDAPCGHSFKLTLGRSTYSVALYRGKKRVEFSGRNWGPSLTSDLAAACYRGDPYRVQCGMAFLFDRIDGYQARPGLQDLWLAATYRGVPEARQ